MRGTPAGARHGERLRLPARGRRVAAARLAVLLVPLLALACAASEPSETPLPEPPPQPAPEWSPDSLVSAFGRIAVEAGGEVGVAAIHVESGRRASWEGDRRLPMASVYKLPIVLEVLWQVDQGVLSLADSITVPPAAFVAGAAPLAAAARGRTVTLTVDRLLSYVLIESDNTASDALLGVVGGPPAVMRRLTELGVAGVDVSRTEAEIFADAGGAGGRLVASAAFPPGDLRDTATADGLADLLGAVVEGAGLSGASRSLLLERLAATPLGSGRLRGLLPAGLVVPHKTGTFGPIVNDVGIVPLPDGTHLAIAVLTRGAGATRAEGERTIARIARAAYDEFARPEGETP